MISSRSYLSNIPNPIFGIGCRILRNYWKNLPHKGDKEMQSLDLKASGTLLDKQAFTKLDIGALIL